MYLSPTDLQIICLMYNLFNIYQSCFELVSSFMNQQRNLFHV
jgi:hypothetical protein